MIRQEGLKLTVTSADPVVIPCDIPYTRFRLSFVAAGTIGSATVVVKGLHYDSTTAIKHTLAPDGGSSPVTPTNGTYATFTGQSWGAIEVTADKDTLTSLVIYIDFDQEHRCSLPHSATWSTTVVRA